MFVDEFSALGGEMVYQIMIGLRQERDDAVECDAQLALVDELQHLREDVARIGEVELHHGQALLLELAREQQLEELAAVCQYDAVRADLTVFRHQRHIGQLTGL